MRCTLLPRSSLPTFVNVLVLAAMACSGGNTDNSAVTPFPGAQQDSNQTPEANDDPEQTTQDLNEEDPTQANTDETPQQVAGSVGNEGNEGNGDPGNGSPGDGEPDNGNPEPTGEEPPTELAEGGFLERPTRGTSNLFTELLAIPVEEVDDKVQIAVNRIFGIGTGEANEPIVDQGYRIYFELPQDNTQAYIWAPDSNDIRSEGMSYGMMIAVQMDMQTEFDRLWNFAQTHMQFPDNTAGWARYFRWQGSVNASNPNNWQVNYNPNTGPAPDGEEYFAAALYLADRRWGSQGAVNYEAEADALTSAMLNNAPGGGRVPVFNAQSNMVVFFPSGGSATFSDPSYHLPAFYELFAEDGPAEDANRWRQIAEISRQYLVTSAHPQTGLHPDYAGFDGTPNAGGDRHDEFRYDAWRVVMNMGVDYAWGSQDARMRQQSEAYHAFFGTRLTENNVENALFQLDGSGADGNGSTALTATLAAGALASNAPNRAEFVENLWEVGQQSGTYRYYQETVYALGLLATAGIYGYEWADSE